MTDRPILFSGPMVRALLDGSKTQTRRIVKYSPADMITFIEKIANKTACCPYGQPGDRLWVRETFSPIYPQDPNYNGGQPIEFDYAATYTHGDRLGDYLGVKKRWKPSIHMPRRASRVTLEVTGVRVERLQDISEADAIAEGVERHRGGWMHYGSANAGECMRFPKNSYRSLWDTLNAKSRPVLPNNTASKRYARVKNWLETHPDTSSWDANPWVWVVEFKRVRV